jgi:hypothetical protein
MLPTASIAEAPNGPAPVKSVENCGLSGLHGSPEELQGFMAQQ